MAKYLLTLWPSPNRPGDPGNGANNFYGQSSSFFERNDVVARVDQNFGDNHRVYVRITDQNSYSNPSDWAGPATSGVRPAWITQRRLHCELDLDRPPHSNCLGAVRFCALG